MHSYNSESTDGQRDFYHLWINSIKRKPFFIDNLDKAFFISMLQDHLSPHKKMRGQIGHGQSYADSIDLTAYSLTTTGVHLLVKPSKENCLDKFAHDMLVGYLNYFLNKHKGKDSPFKSIFIYDKIISADEALKTSIDIHLMHDDWRGDKYSSLGFFLDDRRGDWLKAYHIASLYDFNPANYLAMIIENLSLAKQQLAATS